MDKEEYQNSVQFKELLSLMDKALTDTAAFRNKTDLSPEEISILAEWSDKIMKSMRSLYLYVKNDYLMEFCWWHNIDDARKIETDLDENDKKVQETYKIYKLSNFTYLDKLSSLWYKYREHDMIFVKKNIIKNKKVTIDPSKNNEKVKIELYENETEGTEKDQYCRIPAYSFGPFDAKAYFKSKRILWLLKEPFCEDPDELIKYKDDHEYYDQAKTYDSWSKIEYPTHENLIRRTYDILSTIDVNFSVSSYSEDELMNQVMNNICILEVNHFPGMAFANTDSDDGLIKKWAYLNDNLIEKLIDFYAPQIIICGGTLDSFIGGNYNIIKEKIKLMNLKIFGENIYEMRYMTTQQDNVLGCSV